MKTKEAVTYGLVGLGAVILFSPKAKETVKGALGGGGGLTQIFQESPLGLTAEAFRGLGSQMIGGATTLYTGLGEKMTEGVSGISETVGGVFTGITDVTQRTVGGGIPSTLQGLAQTGQQIGRGLVDVGISVPVGWGQRVKEVGAVVGADVFKTGAKIGSVAFESGQAVGRAVETIVTTPTRTASRIANAVNQALSSVFGGIFGRRYQ